MKEGRVYNNFSPQISNNTFRIVIKLIVFLKAHDKFQIKKSPHSPSIFAAKRQSKIENFLCF
jgi:hypothetical protein